MINVGRRRLQGLTSTQKTGFFTSNAGKNEETREKNSLSPSGYSHPTILLNINLSFINFY